MRVSPIFYLDEEEVPLSSESPDVTGLELVSELEFELEPELELELVLDLISILSELNDAS